MSRKVHDPMPRWLKSGTGRRMLIWLILLASWEGAYRVVQWKSWIFPAPSHVLDAALSLLNVNTAFGSPLHPGWPRPPGVAQAPRAHEPSAFQSPMVVAVLVSTTRLVVGFVISIFLGGLLGLVMWRWIEFDRFLGPLLLGLQ